MIKDELKIADDRFPTNICVHEEGLLLVAWDHAKRMIDHTSALLIPFSMFQTQKKNIHRKGLKK